MAGSQRVRRQRGKGRAKEICAGSRQAQHLGRAGVAERSRAVTAMASARGMVACPAPAEEIFAVRQVPPLRACTAIFAVLPSGDQRTTVLPPCTDALTPGAAGAPVADPGHRRDGGRLGVGGGEFAGDAAAVGDQAFGAPMDVAIPVVADFPGEVDLVGDFRGRAAGVFGGIDAGGGDAGPDRTAPLLPPPTQQARGNFVSAARSASRVAARGNRPSRFSATCANRRRVVRSYPARPRCLPARRAARCRTG